VHQRPAEWLPDRNRCCFADRVVRVRQKYSLTIDRREADALDRVLASCASTAVVRGGARVAARIDPGAAATRLTWTHSTGGMRVRR